MATCVQTSSGGLIYDPANDPATCAMVVHTRAELDSVLPPFNATDAAYVFSWGFGAVILFWSLGMAIDVVLAAIRKL